jgi:hypothetical protein
VIVEVAPESGRPNAGDVEEPRGTQRVRRDEYSARRDPLLVPEAVSEGDAGDAIPVHADTRDECLGT